MRAVLQCTAVAKRADVSWRFAQAGLLTAIPIVLLVGPAIGYYLGTALDRRWSYAPWGMVAGIVLGMVASARVIIQMIQRAKTLDNNDHEQA